MSSNMSGLGFALRQFGYAGRDLALATLKHPFTGGWKRLVFTGPPILLLTSGLGAVIYTVMRRSIGAVASTFYNGSKNLYYGFFGSRRVTPSAPHAGLRTVVILPNPPPAAPKPAEQRIVAMLAPLPVDAAKERNQSLIKLLALIEKLVIDPVVKKKDLISGIECSEPALKSWLMSMTMWRLGIAWEQLEAEYVQWKTPAPPTVESIVFEARQMDVRIGELFDLNSEALFEEITRSDLPQQKKVALFALYLKLNALHRGPQVNEDSKIAEEQELRKKYAQTMHFGMANTLTHMTGIIEGWIKVMNSPSIALMPILPPDSPSNAPVVVSPYAQLVKDVTDQLQRDLVGKYLMPLWDKKYHEWNDSVYGSLPAQGNLSVFDQFINGQMDERTFLETNEGQQLSTSLAGQVCFMRAARAMGSHPESIERSTKAIMSAVFMQLSPTVVDALTKLSDMLTRISFERSVPKVVEYFIELLTCCKTMQEVRSMPDDVNASFVQVPPEGPSSFVEALRRLNIAGDFSETDQLYKNVSQHVSGRKIIEKFPEGSIHKVVVRSLESPEHELGWINVTKERLRTVLKVGAEKYARAEGNWLYRLFKASENGQPTNLASLMLTIPSKLRDIPALEGVMTFLFSGVKLVLEDKAAKGAQTALNELTSTGFLSTTIVTTVVKKLMSNEESKWKTNLPILHQVFKFLQPEERALVLKHLEVLYQGDDFVVRRGQLEAPIDENRQNEINRMLEEENEYKLAADRLFALLGGLNSSAHQEDVALVYEAYERLKREKELLQFNRVKTIVTFVADKKLGEVFTFTGGAYLKDILMKVIHETMTLLTCQEIIKHWIYSIVDIVVDELEESSRSGQVVNAPSPDRAESLLDLIPEDQRNRLLESLTSFLNATEQDRSWLSAKAWILTGFEKVTAWTPNYLWGLIERFKDTLTISPKQLKDRVVKEIGDFGKDPNGLSDSIVQALTEHVADHRLQRA